METQTVRPSRFIEKRWLGEVRRMIISPSIMHLATKVRGVMESTDQELHDGASKFTLGLNIH